MIIQCKCKCGTEFEEYNKWGKKRRFVSGHQNRGVNHPLFGKHHSKKHREGISKGNKGKPKTEEHKRNMSINHADYSGENHPQYGKPRLEKTKQLMSKNRTGKCVGKDHYLYGKTLSDKHKQILSEFHTGKIVSKATKQLISVANIGNLNPNWKGGISKEPYCQEWGKWLKEEIKERDNFQCKNPGCDKEITKTNLLCTHHIDYNKKNCSCDNLITLCKGCNSKANFNREYWKNLYSELSKTKNMVI